MMIDSRFEIAFRERFARLPVGARGHHGPRRHHHGAWVRHPYTDLLRATATGGEVIVTHVVSHILDCLAALGASQMGLRED